MNILLFCGRIRTAEENRSRFALFQRKNLKTASVKAGGSVIY
jgi:hypothetical protein